MVIRLDDRELRKLHIVLGHKIDSLSPLCSLLRQAQLRIKYELVKCTQMRLS